MPGVFNAITARLVERCGFEALYISGAGLANATAGVPDIGLLIPERSHPNSPATSSKPSRSPPSSTPTPASAAPSNVVRTVHDCQRIGLAGIHLEDQLFPKRCGHLAGKSLVTIEEMTEKLRAAVAARTDPDFLLVARTDARSVEGLDRAIERARAYLDAGADAIFPEALQSPSEFRQFARRIDAPLLANMTEFGRSPLLTVKQLERLGYRMVIFPMTAFRVAMRAMDTALRDLKRTGTQKKWIDRMQTRQALYDLLDYDPAQSDWPTRTRRPPKSKKR